MKPCSSLNLSTTYPTQTGLEFNPGLCGESSTTSRLYHVMVTVVVMNILVSIYQYTLRQITEHEYKPIREDPQTVSHEHCTLLHSEFIII
jgi:hypothetical protein